MPVDIYNKNFQNWLKGVLGLKITRYALCKYITETCDEILKDIQATDLKQLFTCLYSNNIFQLKSLRRGPQTWKCKHERCKELMEHFVKIHTERGVLKFKWKQSSCENIDNPVLENEDIDSKWKVVKLYMHVEKEEALVNYNSIDCLDISHVIKVIRNCKVFLPDGSVEPCEKVLNLRNKLMHSPDNFMDEKETQEVFKWTRKLLDCLYIAEKTYYKTAIEELQTHAEKDFVLKYQSEENKKNIEKISKAKKYANELHNSVKDGNQLHKCKCLLDILEQIAGSLLKGNNVLEMKPADYKSMVKKSLEEKSETIASDIAECDENSDEIKQLEILKQNTEKVIEEVEEIIQTKEPEEVIDLINSLNKELEDTKAESHAFINSKDKLEEYKKRNEILKEKTSILNEEKCYEPQLQELNPTWPAHSFSNEEETGCEEKSDDSDFTEADKTLNENSSNPNGNEHQLQELNPSWHGHSFANEEELQCEEKSDAPDFNLADETLNVNPPNPYGNEHKLQELNPTWPGHSFSNEEELQCEEKSDAPDFNLADETLNVNPPNTSGNEHQLQELNPSWHGHSFLNEEELQCEEKSDAPDFNLADETLNVNPPNPYGNEHKLQELNPSWPGHSFSNEEELQCEEKSDAPDFNLAGETLNVNPPNPYGNEHKLQELNPSWPGHSFSNEEELQCEEKSDAPDFNLAGETLNVNPPNPYGNEHKLQELNPSWPGHSFSNEEELQCEEKSDAPDFNLADETLNVNLPNPYGNKPQLPELNPTWPTHSFSNEEESRCEEQNDDPYFILTDETLNENPLNPNALTLNPRQCHVIKWPDFQGYGFEVHEDKKRGGHYIGKIDENSPAENADLREHDRIIEVNNENIVSETHQQVIARIKAGGDETKLLVVDQKADAYYKSSGITVTSQMPEVEFRQTERRSNARTKVTNVDGAPVSVQAPQQTRSEPTVQKSEPAQANIEDFLKLSAKEMRELLAQRKKNNPKQKSNIDFMSNVEIFKEM